MTKHLSYRVNNGHSICCRSLKDWSDMYSAVVALDSIKRIMCWFEAANAGRERALQLFKDITRILKIQRWHVYNNPSAQTVFKNMDVWSKTTPLAGGRKRWDESTVVWEMSLEDCAGRVVRSLTSHHKQLRYLTQEVYTKSDTCTPTTKKKQQKKKTTRDLKGNEKDFR